MNFCAGDIMPIFPEFPNPRPPYMTNSLDKAEEHHTTASCARSLPDRQPHQVFAKDSLGSTHTPKPRAQCFGLFLCSLDFKSNDNLVGQLLNRQPDLIFVIFYPHKGAGAFHSAGQSKEG